MERQLTLRITLEKPPAGVDFGVQRGRGRNYETILRQRSTAKDLHFEFTIGVKVGGKTFAPAFHGPIVQGPPGERFIYIDIGTLAGQADSCWTRRLKIPLAGITREVIERLSDNSQEILEACVPGTGNDGGPTCATVKPFAGWKLRSS